MSNADDNKERNREIARNEEVRQTTGDIRVSAWTIFFAVVVAVILIGVAFAWIKR